jgi:hypothetical protein
MKPDPLVALDGDVTEEMKRRVLLALVLGLVLVGGSVLLSAPPPPPWWCQVTCVADTPPDVRAHWESEESFRNSNVGSAPTPRPPYSPVGRGLPTG